MEGKLFQDKETYQTSRPKEATEDQMDIFYKEKAKEIVNYGYSSYEEDDIIEDLKELFPFYSSGFEMAKQLDDYSCAYTIDSNFISFLENLEHDYNQIIRNNVKYWVKAHNPVHKFNVGDCIKSENKLLANGDTGKDYFITMIREEYAEYCVHVNKDQKGGRVFPFEKIDEICTLVSK